MKRSVWRYNITSAGQLRIQLPADAEVLHVAEHPRDEISLWALVDEQAAHEPREFVIVGTGWPIQHDQLQHIGSVVLRSGFVYHVFETTGEDDGEEQ